MTAQGLWQWLVEQYAHGSPLESASDEPDLLIEALCGIRRAQRIAYPENEIPDDLVQRLRQQLDRRLSGVPLAHVLGQQAFWSFELLVTPDVLIPRGDTECLVEQALLRLPPGARPQTVVDAGTGSGAVAIALALERPALELYACDISAAALEVAAANMARLVPGRIERVQGHWLDWLADQSADMVVSNPPYLAADDPHLQRGGLALEPRQALVAGDAGLADLTSLCVQGRRVLRPGGWLLLEHGHQQGPAVRARLHECDYTRIQGVRDLAGHERVSLACQPGESACPERRGRATDAGGNRAANPTWLSASQSAPW